MSIWQKRKSALIVSISNARENGTLTSHENLQNEKWKFASKFLIKTHPDRHKNRHTNVQDDDSFTTYRKNYVKFLESDECKGNKSNEILLFSMFFHFQLCFQNARDAAVSFKLLLLMI